MGPEGIHENHDNQLWLDCKNAWLYALKFMTNRRGPYETLASGPFPVSTGNGPQPLPEWAFRGKLGLGFAFALKLPEWLNTNLVTVIGKVRANIFFPCNGPRIWFQ